MNNNNNNNLLKDKYLLHYIRLEIYKVTIKIANQIHMLYLNWEVKNIRAKQLINRLIQNTLKILDSNISVYKILTLNRKLNFLLMID